MAKLKLSRTIAMTPDQAWGHASNLAEIGTWFPMHEGWRSEIPTVLTAGTTIVGVAGVKGLRNRVTWTIEEVEPPTRLRMTGRGVGGTKFAVTLGVDGVEGGETSFAVEIDMGGRPLFGPIGATAARLVKGDIERSIERFEQLYG